MHGLVYRSLQCFLTDAYPSRLWHEVAGDIGIGTDGFESMLDYPDALTGRFLGAAARRLDKPQPALLEDLGAYLVGREALRRLLRFGGGTYPDFLLSLEDLPDRVGIALPELRLPPVTVSVPAPGRYRLAVADAAPAADASGRPAGTSASGAAGRGGTRPVPRVLPATLVAPVLAGLVRAMADDYGALALIDLVPGAAGGFEIALDLLEDRYAPGRGFRLAAGGGAD